MKSTKAYEKWATQVSATSPPTIPPKSKGK